MTTVIAAILGFILAKAFLWIYDIATVPSVAERLRCQHCDNFKEPCRHDLAKARFDKKRC